MLVASAQIIDIYPGYSDMHKLKYNLNLITYLIKPNKIQS